MKAYKRPESAEYTLTGEEVNAAFLAFLKQSSDWVDIVAPFLAVQTYRTGEHTKVVVTAAVSK